MVRSTREMAITRGHGQNNPISPEDILRATQSSIRPLQLSHSVSSFQEFAPDMVANHNGTRATSSGTYFLSPGALSNESVPAFDEYAANPLFQELQGELRSLLFNGANTTVPSRQPSPPHGNVSDSTIRSPGHRRLLELFRTDPTQISLMTRVKYLNIWIAECAPWLDMFDQARHFGIYVLLLAQDSPAVLYALLALSARQAERQSGKNGALDSLKLYSQAISSLPPALDATEPTVIVTACILCVLEMMSVSPREWRSHVEGCAALFEAAGVNGFSGGLPQAVFWCYARMDLCGAIIADGSESTVLPIAKWVSPSSTPAAQQDAQIQEAEVKAAFLEAGQLVPDMHANYAVYLCAKVCDLLARHTRHVELGNEDYADGHSFEEIWVNLWDELQEWWERRPSELLPVKTVSTSMSSDRFPRIMFAHWAAISSNQLYHTACILMSEIQPPGLSSVQRESVHLPLYHARRVVGISLTNSHKGCLANAIQPLYVAGKLFSHRDEQAVVVDVIKQIEASTGWGSRWRIEGLESVWGYRRGTFTAADLKRS